MSLRGWVQREIIGNEPPPRDHTPRHLSDKDLDDLLSIQRSAGMATYQEMLFVMSKFAGSDWVRVRRLRKDLRWLGRKAQSIGVEWTDLP